MREKVYVVRLTEEERSDALCGPGGTGLPLWIRHKIESAHPEHPKRQEALEELGQAAIQTRNMNSPEQIKRFIEAVDRFRSLEGK